MRHRRSASMALAERRPPAYVVEQDRP